MNTLTLSWAICSIPHVKAAVTDPHMRETAELIQNLQGNCESIGCVNCPLHHKGCLAIRLPINCYGSYEVNSQRRVVDILSIVLNRGRP